MALDPWSTLFGSSLPPLQLERPNADYLDENTLYVSPQDLAGPPQLLPQFKYTEVPGVGSTPPSVDTMFWRKPPLDLAALRQQPHDSPSSTNAPASPVVPGSRARALSPPAAEIKQEVSQATEPGEDKLLATYNSKGDQLNRERQDTVAKALGEKNLSDDEKVAMALLAVLPGLAGAIGGGAIAGGWGAAAGAAGGLQGGAQGAQSIANAKNERRKEALDEAADLATRMDRTDAQAAGRVSELDQRKFASGEADKGRQFTAEQGKLGRDASAKEHASDRAAHRGDIMLQGKVQENLHRIDAAAEIQKAEAKARSDAGGKLKEEDKSFYSNSAAALRNLDELEKLVGSHGNFESTASYSPLSDPKAGAKLGQLAYDTAVAYAKLIDPATAAREGEVESAKKYAIPMGAGTSNDATLEAIQHMKGLIAERAKTRNQLGTPLSPEASAQIDRQRPQAVAPDHLKSKYGF